jgi:hypothetical protein
MAACYRRISPASRGSSAASPPLSRVVETVGLTAARAVRASRHSRTVPHPGARGTPRDHLPLADDRGTATGSG